MYSIVLVCLKTKWSSFETDWNWQKILLINSLNCCENVVILCVKHVMAYFVTRTLAYFVLISIVSNTLLHYYYHFPLYSTFLFYMIYPSPFVHLSAYPLLPLFAVTLTPVRDEPLSESEVVGGRVGVGGGGECNSPSPLAHCKKMLLQFIYQSMKSHILSKLS